MYQIPVRFGHTTALFSYQLLPPLLLAETTVLGYLTESYSLPRSTRDRYLPPLHRKPLHRDHLTCPVILGCERVIILSLEQVGRAVYRNWHLRVSD